jgi:hypothetical protein
MSKIRNPKPTDTDFCLFCGMPYAHLHEVYFGKNSQLSKQHGFQVRLCANHHTGTNGVHGINGHSLDNALKMATQMRYELTHTREEFMKIIGRNYIE